MPRIVIIDIETTSTDPISGFIVGIGLLFMDSGKESFIFCSKPENEKHVLNDFLGKIQDIDIIITWNGNRFDIPFILARALRNNLDLSELLSKKHIDLAVAIRRLFVGDGRFPSLDALCRFLGIKRYREVRGYEIPALYIRYLSGENGVVDLIKEKCMDDVRVLREIYLRIKPYLEKME